MRTLALLHVVLFLVGFIFGMVMALRRRLHRARVRIYESDLAVSVLKPLCGAESALEANLRSFAKLRVPNDFEVILLVDSEEDGAITIARKMVREFPTRFKLHIGTATTFSNPKIASLVAGLPRAKNGLIWITDSNVEATDAHLQSLVRTWMEVRQRRPALVHAPLLSVGGTGLGAACDRAHLSSYNNVNGEIAVLVNIHTVVGKSILIHRDDLRAVGGFEAFGHYSGEDFQLGIAVAKQGIVRCAPIAVRQAAEDGYTLRQWFARHLRWAIVRKPMTMPFYLLLEHLTYPGVSTLLCVATGAPWQWIAIVMGVKMAGDSLMHRTFGGRWLGLSEVLLVPVKELMLVGVWTLGLFRTNVKWRGRALRVGKDSTYTPIISRAPPASLQR